MLPMVLHPRLIALSVYPVLGTCIPNYPVSKAVKSIFPMVVHPRSISLLAYLVAVYTQSISPLAYPATAYTGSDISLVYPVVDDCAVNNSIFHRVLNRSVSKAL